MVAKQIFYLLSLTSYTFCSGYFGDEVLQTICQGFSLSMMLPITASQEARIIGVSHKHPAVSQYLSSNSTTHSSKQTNMVPVSVIKVDIYINGIE
jgi:hypothetical protein